MRFGRCEYILFYAHRLRARQMTVVIRTAFEHNDVAVRFGLSNDYTDSSRSIK